MEQLGKLFGSEAKVKIMRLFLFNPETVFDTGEISERAKVEPSKVRREMSNLEKMGLVKRRASSKKRGGHGFVLETQFSYLTQLQNFLINIEPLLPKEIIRKVSKIGNIKLIIIAGVFLQEAESRIDLLIVGDGIKKANLENLIKTLEAEIGKELRYAHFTTEDFKYRISMFDKLIRDILDYPHRKILNKTGIV
jgi:DNA-binding MarR family transcriptional regulator